MRVVLRLWLWILNRLHASRCKTIKDKDFWTGEEGQYYICGCKRWLCRYYVRSIIERKSNRKECISSYNAAFDDYIRCGNDDAVREKLMVDDRKDSVYPK